MLSLPFPLFLSPTWQSEDAVVFAMPDHPVWMCGAEVTDDGEYLLLYLSEGCQPANRVYYVRLDAVPRSEGGALDFKDLDFHKGEDEGLTPT